ncbi:PREDICTED: LOC109950577, partial [Prunus dulcis]
FSEVGAYLQGAGRRVEWVRAQLSETECECGNLVTQKNLLESGLLQGMAGIIRGSTKVSVDIDDAEMQKWLRESRAKMAEKGTGKRPRDDDEGRVADVLGKRKALEEAHQHVMGAGPRFPPFDLQGPPKFPFGMEDIFAEGVEKVDFGRLRQQKKEVNLAMHRQEVPLVNVFLEGVKSDPEALARTPASSYIDQTQKTIISTAH